jgi:hypothetical protein
MRQEPEPREFKRYQITVDVYVKALLLAYREADTSLKISDLLLTSSKSLPGIEEIIEFEMGFVSASGIHVIDVNCSEDSIFIEWTIEDVALIVKERFNKSISNNDGFKVLDFVKAKHDRTIGINWMVLEEGIEVLLERKEITLIP